MDFICYPKCSTCKRAQVWLDENDKTYTVRDIKTDNPTVDELRVWHSTSGLPLRRFFNTSGLLYKELGLKDRLPDMSDDEMYELLSTDGMLVKRPILVDGNTILVGFREAEWKEKLL